MVGLIFTFSNEYYPNFTYGSISILHCGYLYESEAPWPPRGLKLKPEYSSMILHIGRTMKSPQTFNVFGQSLGNSLLS